MIYTRRRVAEQSREAGSHITLPMTYDDPKWYA